MSNPAPLQIYSIDTSSLMDWQARYYPTDVFSGLIERMDSLIGLQRVFAPALVKEEVGVLAQPD